MTEHREPEAEPHFSQPVRQIISMIFVLVLVGAGLYVGLEQISAIFFANQYLNGAILAVFVLGVLSTFGQVYQLMRSVEWIEGFAANRVGHNLTQAPSLLAPLATLLRSRGAMMQISSTSSRSIQDSVAQRIDEDREITRYIGNTLIFLGLLGTFYGLATTVPALVETIRSLNPAEGESGADVFGRLQQGLESQLGGMGTAFSSSLLGLAGSLVVGLLELFASHGQNRFYRELEDWLSTITRVGFAGEEGGNVDQGAIAQLAEHMATRLDQMQAFYAESNDRREAAEDRLGMLAHAVSQLSDRLEEGDVGSGPDMTPVVESQNRLTDALETLVKEGTGQVDAESRMRLRSMDVQMLRILEEMSAGRQESLGEIRADLAQLTKAIRALARDRAGGPV